MSGYHTATPNNTNRSNNDYAGSRENDASYSDEGMNRRNVELKGSLGDQEERISRAIDGLVSFIRSWRNESSKTRAASHASLRTLAEKYKWAQPCGFDLPALIHDFALSIPTSRLDSLGLNTTAAGASQQGSSQPAPHVPNVEECRHVVDRALGRGAGRGEGATSRAIVPALCGRVPAANHYNGPYAERLADALNKLSEVGGEEALKVVKERLNQTSTAVTEMRGAADACNRQRSTALEAEDFSRAEQSQVEEVSSLEKLLNILRERLSEAMMGAADTGSHRSAVDAAAGTVASVLHDMAAAAEGTAHDVGADLETLRVKGATEEQRHSEAGGRFVEWYNDAVRQVDHCEREMEQTLEQVDALCAHLEKLSTRRHRLVNEVVVEVERESRRRAYYDEYTHVAASHARALAGLQASMHATVRSAVEMRRALDRFLEGERSGGPDGDVRALQVGEIRDIVSTFRRFSLTAGDLLERKERRSKGCEKMLRQLQYQVSVAKDALDPDVPKYREQFEDLSRTRAAVVDAVERLRQSLDQQYEQYLSVVALCPRLGEPVPPDPTAELRDVAIRDRSRFLALTRDFQTVEESALEAEAVALRHLSGGGGPA